MRQQSNTRVLTTSEIDDFANRLRATVQLASQHQALMSRLTELLGRGAAQQVAAQVGVGGAAGRRGGRRPTLDDQAVLDMIRRNSAEGTAAGDIQREFGASPFQVKGVIQRLRAAKVIRVTGQKRGTRYFSTEGGGSESGGEGGKGGRKRGATAKKGKASAAKSGQEQLPAS